jgi:hypothetical protein
MAAIGSCDLKSSIVAGVGTIWVWNNVCIDEHNDVVVRILENGRSWKQCHWGDGKTLTEKASTPALWP